MSIMPLSEFSGEQDNTSNNRIMRWRERYYRQEAAISTLKAQRDELLAAVKKIECNTLDANIAMIARAAIANAENPPCA